MVQSFLADEGKSYRNFLNCPNGILVTASTVFWEGITINGLNLLIIFERPFPRPRLVDLLNKKAHTGNLDMSRRLRQGIGRVGRKKGDSGLSLTLFDINQVGKGNFQKMFSDVKVRFAYSFETTVIVHKIFIDKNSPVDFFKT